MSEVGNGGDKGDEEGVVEGVGRRGGVVTNGGIRRSEMGAGLEIEGEGRVGGGEDKEEEEVLNFGNGREEKDGGVVDEVVDGERNTYSLNTT